MKPYLIFAIAWLVCCASIVTGQTPWSSLDTPWPRHTIDASSRGADGVKVADVNGDGRMDITTGWEEGGVVRVYLHPGEKAVREPWPYVEIGEVPNVEDAAFIDFDFDGRLDVVSAAEGDRQALFVHYAPVEGSYLQSAAWSYHAIPSTERLMQWMFTIPFEVNGSPGKELIAAGKNDGSQIGWLERVGPHEVAWHPIAPVSWVMSILPADLDGDGQLDLLYSDRKGHSRGVYVLYHRAQDGLAYFEGPEFLAGRAYELMFMAFGNVNNDQTPEIAVATSRSGVLLLSKTNEQWVERLIPYPASTGTGKGIALGDIDNDSQTDIVLTSEHAAGKYGVYYFTSAAGSWKAVDIGGLEGTKFDRIELLDMDGDNDLDVLTCEEKENLGVIWYENPAVR